jgi:hypothetical protein
MNFPFNTMTLRVISTLLCTTSLVACGGGGNDNNSTESVQAGLIVAKGDITSSALAVATPLASAGDTATSFTKVKTGGSETVVAPLNPIVPVAPGATVPVAQPAGTLAVITDVRLENTGTAAQTLVPVTFGQVFAVGHVKTTDVMVGRLEDNTLVTLQMDVKARHADGSVRHAIFSAIIPSIDANAVRTMSLAKNAVPSSATAALPAALLASGFTASTSATIGGIKYSASADRLLKTGAKATWLAGAVANEWHVSAPLTTAAGVSHPHLTARFAVRYYSAVKKARVDVTIENNWAFEPNPQNFKYNAEVTVGGKSAYSKADVTHLVQARWRKVFWWGGDAPQITPIVNSKYLIATRAVPNYDQSITIAPGVLTAYAATFSTPSSTDPMKIGLAVPYMPMTGAHEDIGILPSWAANYLLSMDKRALGANLRTGDLSGSFSAHYRDKITDRPVSLKNFPYMTIAGRSTDTGNPVTGKMEAFPGCGGDCATPYTHDIPHQPSLAYLPYLVTGDFYYLEELQFWAMYDVFASNPNYREREKGLLIPEQIRGQAWGLRTLAQATYITPDTDELKGDFTTLLNNNLDWYNQTYSNNPNANKLNVIINGFAIGYNNNTALAPWQDDFFTSAVGHTVDLGFTKANALLAWKSKFAIGRMTAPGVCWIDAAVYDLKVRDNETSPLYTTLAQAYTANRGAEFMALPCAGAAMAAALGLQIGDMGNISGGYMGYPSNIRQERLDPVHEPHGQTKLRGRRPVRYRSALNGYSSRPARMGRFSLWDCL